MLQTLRIEERKCSHANRQAVWIFNPFLETIATGTRGKVVHPRQEDVMNRAGENEVRLSRFAAALDRLRANTCNSGMARHTPYPVAGWANITANNEHRKSGKTSCGAYSVITTADAVVEDEAVRFFLNRELPPTELLALQLDDPVARFGTGVKTVHSSRMVVGWVREAL